MTSGGSTSTLPRKPFDDRAARDRYLDIAAGRADGGPDGLILPGLELERRGRPAPPFNRALLGRFERDWHLPVPLWLLLRYRGSRQLTDADRLRLREVILRTHFRMDEPGQEPDGGFTGNHPILFLVNGYLAARLFPDAVFANAGTCLRRWLDRRLRFGFSEWKSFAGFDAVLAALLTLREFTPEEDLRRLADRVIDVVLLQYALCHFNGGLACSQGRSAWQTIVRGEESMPGVIGSLAFGIGRHTGTISTASILLACGSYEVPPVLQAIARDRDGETEVRECEGLDVAEASSFGVDPARDADALSRVDEYLYRTPHWQLSCAQDYRPGQPGPGEHIWQATLGGRAVIFTTHPGGDDLKGRPNYWSANGSMPRAAAWRNVLICVYRIDPHQHRFHASHAYFPCFAFDEVVERGGWVFGRLADGYVALRSLVPAGWRAPDPEVVKEIYCCDAAARERALQSRYELLAPGCANAWICELGNCGRNGSFARFIEGVAAAPVTGSWERLAYQSPTCGVVEFGWTRAFVVGGREIGLHQPLRLDSPYGRAEFGSDRLDLQCDGLALRHDTAAT